MRPRIIRGFLPAHPITSANPATAGRRREQTWLPAAICLGAFLGLLAARQWTGAAIGATLPLIVGLTSVPGTAPIVPAALALQWCQVSLGSLYSGLTGRTLLALSSSNTDRAILLGLVALVAVALGFRIAVRAIDTPQQRESQLTTVTPTLVLAALGASIVAPALQSLTWAVPSLTQPLKALLLLKWAILFVFVRALITHSKLWPAALGLFGLELFLGFTSFFSSWKSFLFVALVAILSARERRLAWRLATAAALCAALLGLGMVWLSVRGSLRQEILARPGISRSERLVHVRSVASREADISLQAADALLNRVTYVYYFSEVLGWVPARRPHTSGGQYLAAFRHIFMPRALFPEKPALVNDSALVREFTGIPVPVVPGGTSISVGYVAETYVDFGIQLMFLPLLLWGFLLGSMVRALLKLGLPAVLSDGLMMATFFFSLYQFEITLVKLIGGQVTAFLVIYALGRVFGRRLGHYLIGPQSLQ